jgi:molybdopterin-guanine dinucleotide biosynthesis protein
MRIITVSGSRSGVGKTTLAVLLIARLQGYAAIKVTTTDLFVSVTDDPEKISAEGKDTALMKDAGASPVIWVQSPAEELSEAFSYALNLAGDAAGVIVEGNSPVRLIKPDTAFFVTGVDLEDVKPGALHVLAKADVVVVNAEDDEPAADIKAAIRVHNKLAVITTMNRMRQMDGELEELYRKLRP